MNGRNEDPYALEQNPVTGIVYFVQAVHGGPVKIGITKPGGLKSRVKSLQTGNPFSLVVRHTIECDSRQPATVLEMDLHSQFKSARVQGEWFRPIPEIVALCGAIPESDVDPDTASRLGAEYSRGVYAGWNACIESSRERLQEAVDGWIETQQADGEWNAADFIEKGDA